VLAAGQRLRRSGEFAAAIRGGRRAGRGSVVVHLALPTADAPPTTALPTVELPPARAGFVVSRAVGGAVDRNTVRRRLRHLVRERLPELPPGATLVVRALPGAAHVPYSQLRMDLGGALAAARGRSRGQGGGGRGRRAP
jgi:ribonuclease P protein component